MTISIEDITAAVVRAFREGASSRCLLADSNGAPSVGITTSVAGTFYDRTADRQSIEAPEGLTSEVLATAEVTARTMGERAGEVAARRSAEISAIDAKWAGAPMELCGLTHQGFTLPRVKLDDGHLVLAAYYNPLPLGLGQGGEAR